MKIARKRNAWHDLKKSEFQCNSRTPQPEASANEITTFHMARKIQWSQCDDWTRWHNCNLTNHTLKDSYAAIRMTWDPFLKNCQAKTFNGHQVILNSWRVTLTMNPKESKVSVNAPDTGKKLTSRLSFFFMKGMENSKISTLNSKWKINFYQTQQQWKLKRKIQCIHQTQKPFKIGHHDDLASTTFI